MRANAVVEESAIFGGSAGELSADGRHIHLATTFLSNGARTKKGRRSLGFSLDLRVQVPEYVVDRRWFRDDHFDGGYLFRDKINLQASFSSKKGWMLTWHPSCRSATPCYLPRVMLALWCRTPYCN